MILRVSLLKSACSIRICLIGIFSKLLNAKQYDAPTQEMSLSQLIIDKGREQSECSTINQKDK